MATSSTSNNLVKTKIDNMYTGKKKKCASMAKIKRVKKSPRKILASKK